MRISSPSAYISRTFPEASRGRSARPEVTEATLATGSAAPCRPGARATVMICRMDRSSAPPPLPFDAWATTKDTLHLWAQVVGKVRLALAPPRNHWWHVTLHLDVRGLTTRPFPAGEGT